MTAEVARNYFVLRGLQDQLAVAERNEVNQRQTLDLTQVRLDAGRGTELDISRAEAQLATTLASIPPLRVSIATTIYRLSVLTGRQPDVLTPSCPRLARCRRCRSSMRSAIRKHCCVAGRTFGSQSAISPRRPRASVFRWPTCFRASRSSGRQAMTRHRGVMSARAASQSYSVGPSITWAAFDLGRVRARIGIAHAQTDVALAAYEAAVLNALEDTENSLVSYGESQRREATLVRAATQSTTAARLARQRFEGGLSDFLSVLQAERDALAAEDSLAQGRTQTATSLIAVYKALGGGWMTP